MDPGSDPLDPLELALLIEAAENPSGFSDREDDDLPPGGADAEDGGEDDEEG